MSTSSSQVNPRARWHIDTGERGKLALAAGTYFLLLCGYYMLRSLREAMALAAGREHIPLLFTVTFVVMMALLPGYWWVVARVRRDRLLAVLYLPVVVIIGALATFAGRDHVPPHLAALYFVLVTSLNLFIVSVFWSVMADTWRPEAAKRLFGMVAAGGSLGALTGPAFNALFVERLGATGTIYIACTLLAVAVATGIAAQRMRVSAPQSAADPRTAVGGRAIDDLKRLARSPYLLAIAGFIVVGQWLGAFMYNEQARYVEAAHAELTQRAALFARIDLASNVLALLAQGVIVGWLTVRGGVRATLTAMWALAAASFALLALVPTGAVLLATQIVRRAGDYGLFKPSREMLFTVLAPASKFKSKSLLDTVLQRGADSVGNGLYLLIAPLGLAGIAGLCASACVLLILCSRWLGAAFDRQESQASSSL
ncbi:MAG: MFS transporter [Steroidobacteraceae bacterium]|nr:MFS transporter [Steroidobacteraceae bacterium]